MQSEQKLRRGLEGKLAESIALNTNQIKSLKEKDSVISKLTTELDSLKVKNLQTEANDEAKKIKLQTENLITIKALNDDADRFITNLEEVLRNV